MREGAADRDVHEEEPERRVTEAGAGPEIEDSARQEQRADDHRGRLGDEGPEYRSDRERGEPPGEGGPASERGEETHQTLGEEEDGRVEAIAITTNTNIGSVKSTPP